MIYRAAKPGGYTLEFEVPRLPSMGLNARRHWAKVHRENQLWLKEVSAATIGRRPHRPLEHASVHLIRRSAVRPDHDNLVASFKPIIDALEKLRIIRSDSPDCIGEPFCHWHEAPRGKGSIWVSVGETEPPERLSP